MPRPLYDGFRTARVMDAEEDFRRNLKNLIWYFVMLTAGICLGYFWAFDHLPPRVAEIHDSGYVAEWPATIMQSPAGDFVMDEPGGDVCLVRRCS